MSMANVPRRIAIITGTSGNLGINIAYRLLEEVPKRFRLTIIVTSRTLVKASKTIHQIKDYNEKKNLRSDGYLDFDYLLLDFSDMVSVLSAVHSLEENYEKIDYLFLNASQNTHDHFNYVEATKEMLTDPVRASTNPGYKIEKRGVKSKDGLGLVFQVNVFAPYYLIEKIKGSLLAKSDDARIIWISSILGRPENFSFNDMQLLKTGMAYGGSKRLVDLLHLATYKELKEKYGIRQYLTHPGIFVSYTYTRFLNVFMYYGMLALFLLARWLGSPWLNIDGWKAANAPIYASVKADKEDDQSLKYGSACTKGGDEYLKTTTVDSTGKDDVLQYIETLKKEWDEKFRDQITDSRKL